MIQCPDCGGSGGLFISLCDRCKGSGKIEAKIEWYPSEDGVLMVGIPAHLLKVVRVYCIKIGEACGFAMDFDNALSPKEIAEVDRSVRRKP